jgi:glutamine synthetase
VLKVLNARELQSRYEIMVETYNKTVNVEGQLMVLMAKRYILPAAIEYQKNVAHSVAALKGAGASSPETKKVLATVIKLTGEFSHGIDKLQKALDHGGGDAGKHAKHVRDAVIPAMTALRNTGNALEQRLAAGPNGIGPAARYDGHGAPFQWSSLPTSHSS